MSKSTASPPVTVLGAGYTGLTTAAELSLRGHKVRVIAKDSGQMPPLTIAGTQSRRWPGTSTSNRTFSNDDLLWRELKTISRLLPLAAQPDSGVHIVPALKVSKKKDNSWNKRPIEDPALLQASTECQRNLRLAVSPASVGADVVQRFHDRGFHTVDETQVVKIITSQYFEYLKKLILARGGQILMGVQLNPEDIAAIKTPVVNCLGLGSQSSGGAAGEYFNSRGECVIVKDCPSNFGFYVMDDDVSAGVMQTPEGGLYLSSGAEPDPSKGYDPDCTQQTIADCEDVCKALFGAPLPQGTLSAMESWHTDRPMRSEGFNLGLQKLPTGNIMVNNNGHGGAGVTASWACASMAADKLFESSAGTAMQSRL